MSPSVHPCELVGLIIETHKKIRKQKKKTEIGKKREIGKK